MKPCLVAFSFLFIASVLAPPPHALAGPPEDVTAAMQTLKSKAAQLGAPAVKGEEQAGDKTVPGLI